MLKQGGGATSTSAGADTALMDRPSSDFGPAFRPYLLDLTACAVA